MFQFFCLGLIAILGGKCTCKVKIAIYQKQKQTNDAVSFNYVSSFGFLVGGRSIGMVIMVNGHNVGHRCVAPGTLRIMSISIVTDSRLGAGLVVSRLLLSWFPRPGSSLLKKTKSLVGDSLSVS